MPRVLPEIPIVSLTYGGSFDPFPSAVGYATALS